METKNESLLKFAESETTYQMHRTADSLLNAASLPDISEKESGNDDSDMVDLSTESITPKSILDDPDAMGMAVYENYLRTSGKILTGKQKRTLRRECIRNAKKGKYNYLFDGSREKQAKESFDKLNGPAMKPQS